MKENTKQKILKYLRIILPVTVVIYLYQLTIVDYISFCSLSVDYMLYYTTKSLFLFNLAGIALYFYCKQKIKSVKMLSLIIFFPVGLLFLVYFPFNVLAVINPHYDKYYFYERNGTEYYMISERFSALDGMELKFYKENSLVGFIKIRSQIVEEDLPIDDIDIQKERDHYWQKYFMKSQ